MNKEEIDILSNIINNLIDRIAIERIAIGGSTDPIQQNLLDELKYYQALRRRKCAEITTDFKEYINESERSDSDCGEPEQPE